MTKCTSPPDWDDPNFELPVIPDGVAVETVTEGCVEGKGIYDVFMQAHVDAIHREYGKNRIKGSEYSKVYLGGMQAAMQQAVVFALSKDESAAKKELAKYEILKSQAAIELIHSQVCETEKKIELLQAQREMTAAQTWAEIAKTDGLHIKVLMTELLAGIYTGPIHLAPDNSLIGSQVTKIVSERDLLVQKKLTEVAQIEDISPLGKPYAGVVGKEKNLLQRQADGFIRDAEAKIAKIATDAFAVQYSTLDGVSESDDGWGWDAPNLYTMLENAYTNMANASHTTTPVPDFFVQSGQGSTDPSWGDRPQSVD